MKRLLLLPLLLLVCAFGSCQRKPNVPREVTITVEVYKPLPDWATDPLPKPEAADGKIASKLTSENQRGNVIDLANCHRRLLKKLDREEPVDRKECER